jgi:hypothetical protein
VAFTVHVPHNRSFSTEISGAYDRSWIVASKGTLELLDGLPLLEGGISVIAECEVAGRVRDEGWTLGLGHRANQVAGLLKVTATLASGPRPSRKRSAAGLTSTRQFGAQGQKGSYADSILTTHTGPCDNHGEDASLGAPSTAPSARGSPGSLCPRSCKSYARERLGPGRSQTVHQPIRPDRRPCARSYPDRRPLEYAA